VSKVWPITGASRGLGRAFTEEALKAAYPVVAAARNAEDLVDVTSKFGEVYGPFRSRPPKSRRPSPPSMPRSKRSAASTSSPRLVLPQLR
jgi:NAD(P)-dependent dehydrogenase (short-subunit alcohol dehydrogenase family)